MDLKIHQEVFGEYLSNAEGEDVVAGMRTPVRVQHMKSEQPYAYDMLVSALDALEKHHRDIQVAVLSFSLTHIANNNWL